MRHKRGACSCEGERILGDGTQQKKSNGGQSGSIYKNICSVSFTTIESEKIFAKFVQ